MDKQHPPSGDTAMFIYIILIAMMVGMFALFHIVSRPTVLTKSRKILGHRMTYLIAWMLVAMNWLTAGTLLIGYGSGTITGTDVNTWFIAGATVIFIAYIAMYLRIVDELERMQKIEEFSKSLDYVSGRFLNRAEMRIRNRNRRGIT